MHFVGLCYTDISRCTVNRMLNVFSVFSVALSMVQIIAILRIVFKTKHTTTKRFSILMRSRSIRGRKTQKLYLNPLNPELNSICYLLALLGVHHFLHVSRIRVKLLTFRLLMSYIYGAHILGVSRSHTTTQHSR